MYAMSFRSYAGGMLAAALIAGAGVVSAPLSNADSPVYVDPTGYGQQTGQSAGQPSSLPGRTMGAVQASNSGGPGQCTWGALQKAFENVGYYPDIHGNAKLWADSARSRGWTVVDEPQARSIAVYPSELPGVSEYGHVAWVNSVSGRWINITEMNNESHGGPFAWWTRDTQHIPGMSYILLP
ncbi:amidase [Mycolicibacterium aubagnense]|nr:amidase [Mycolicibacterium aubagnense]